MGLETETQEAKRVGDGADAKEEKSSLKKSDSPTELLYAKIINQDPEVVIPDKDGTDLQKYAHCLHEALKLTAMEMASTRIKTSIRENVSTEGEEKVRIMQRQLPYAYQQVFSTFRDRVGFEDPTAFGRRIALYSNPEQFFIIIRHFPKSAIVQNMLQLMVPQALPRKAVRSESPEPSDVQLQGDDVDDEATLFAVASRSSDKPTDTDLDLALALSASLATQPAAPGRDSDPAPAAAGSAVRAAAAARPSSGEAAVSAPVAAAKPIDPDDDTKPGLNPTFDGARPLLFTISEGHESAPGTVAAPAAADNTAQVAVSIAHSTPPNGRRPAACPRDPGMGSYFRGNDTIRPRRQPATFIEKALVFIEKWPKTCFFVAALFFAGVAALCSIFILPLAAVILGVISVGSILKAITFSVSCGLLLSGLIFIPLLNHIKQQEESEKAVELKHELGAGSPQKMSAALGPPGPRAAASNAHTVDDDSAAANVSSKRKPVMPSFAADAAVTMQDGNVIAVEYAPRHTLLTQSGPR